MARTPSTMLLPLGSPAPEFSLPDPAGKLYSLRDLSAGAKATLVMFICNHCPYVQLVRPELARLASDYAKRGVAIAAINSNDWAAHPDDSPDNMAREAITYGYEFPYLLDESQEVARAYRAACTPDFFLFDADLGLAYRGRLDDARPGTGIEPNGHDLRTALDAILSGSPVPEPQLPSLGCNIKWRPGNEPG